MKKYRLSFLIMLFCFSFLLVACEAEDDEDEFDDEISLIDENEFEDEDDEDSDEFEDEDGDDEDSDEFEDEEDDEDSDEDDDSDEEGEDEVDNEPEDQVVVTVPPVSVDVDISRLIDSATQNEQGFLEFSLPNGLSFIYIPEGSFLFGSDSLTEEEMPQHSVFLDGYWISKYEVTNGQFASFVDGSSYKTTAEQAGADGCFVYDEAAFGFVPTAGRYWKNAFADQKDTHPVSCVSYVDAVAYTEWLSNQFGGTFSLPTEAQWEKAGRGREGFLFSWGNNPPNGKLANYADSQFAEGYPDSEQGMPDLDVDDQFAGLAPVGSYPDGASPYGVMDMSGNVSEWVLDSFAPYDQSQNKNPVNSSRSDNDRVNRGGNWVDSAGLTGVQIEEGHNIRIAARTADDASSSDDHMGFRIVLLP